MYKIVYETTATDDFEVIRSYFLKKENSTIIADKIINKIIKRASKLKTMPTMYRKSEYNPAFRLFTESNYLVHYLVNDEAKSIEIHYVWHGMRDIQQLFEDLNLETDNL